MSRAKRWPLRPTTLLIISGWLVAPGASARAESPQPLVSDRPDFTESAAVVGPRSVQLEAGYTFARQGAATLNSAGELLLRAGLAGWAELRVGLNSLAWVDAGGQKASGFEDLFVGAKLGLLARDANWSLLPQIALLLGTTIPTGDDELGSDGAQPEAKLALAWSLGERLGVGSNLNFASLSDSGDRFGQFSASLAFGLALGPRLGSYLEYYGFSRESRDGPAVDFLNGGQTFLVSDDLQLDARAGVGLNEPDPEYFIGLGFVLRRRL